MSNTQQSNGQQRTRSRSQQRRPVGSRGWQQNQLTKDEIDAIVESEVADEQTAELMKIYLSKDLPMGYMSPKRFHEFKYKLKNRILELFAEHPPEGSGYRGIQRQIALGDKRRRETPLTGPQRSKILKIEEMILTRAERAVEGWQQEQINEQRQVNINERRDDREEQRGELVQR